MMQRWGRVTALDGNHATIDLILACSACSGETCALSWQGKKQTQLTVPRRPEWKLGQKVALGIEPGNLLRLALVGYGLPLLGFWVGMVVGMPGGELLAGATALAGLLVALALSRRYDARRQDCLNKQLS